MFEYMIMPFKRYADFKGRSRRMEYWSFFLLNFIVVLFLVFVMLGTGAASGAFADIEAGDPGAAFAMMFGGFGLIILLYSLAVLIPTIAVTIRRLHDRDMSGWWYGGLLIASFIPIVNFLAMIGNLVLFVILLLPGTPGPNRYGPDPKDPANIDVFS